MCLCFWLENRVGIDLSRAFKPLGQINTVLVPEGTVALLVIRVRVFLTEEDNGHLEKLRVGSWGGVRADTGYVGSLSCTVLYHYLA